MTYTVFGSTAPEGLIDQAKDLAEDAVERMQGSVSPKTMRPSLRRAGYAFVHHLDEPLRGGRRTPREASTYPRPELGAPHVAAKR